MEIIDFSSDIANGQFLFRFTFEDDTDVFLDQNGWECVNFNNVKDDYFYIEIAQNFYKNLESTKNN